MSSRHTHAHFAMKAAGVFVCLFISGSAFSFVDLRLTGGTYDGKYKLIADGTGTDVTEAAEKATAKGTQISAFLDLAPIPMVPFAIGAFYSTTSAKGTYTSELDSSVSSGRGGLDVMVWAPVPKIRPYLRGGYYLFGKEDLTFKTKSDAPISGSIKYSMAVKGYQIGAGIGISILPMMSLYLDYAMDRYDLTTKKVTVTVDSVSETADLAENVKIKNEASTISLGIGFSI